MTDSLSHGLGYGQYGDCTYDIEKRQWSWKQRLEETSHFQSIGASTFVASTQDDAFENAIIKASRADQALGLVNAIPSLGPAREILNDTVPSLSEQSAGREDDDINHGHCLAIGRIPDDLYHGERITVAAFPAGASSTNLRLVQIRRQRQGWENEKSIWLNVPILQGESGYWNADSPIQQILFSTTEEDHSCLLAVRTLSATFILRPRLRDHVVSSTGASRLSIAVLVAINFDQLEVAAHVDLCFNPWYRWQFATIDRTGYWCVWDVGPSRDPSRIAKLAQTSSGHVNDVKDNLESSQTISRKSYRISWIGNISTILICGTKSISIVDIGSRLPTDLSLDLGHSSLILDIQDDPLHLGRVVLLTNAHIFYLTVASGNEIAGLEVLLKAQHFCDFADRGLRVSTFASEERTLLFIRSSASRFIEVHEIYSTQSPVSICAATFWIPSDGLLPQIMTLEMLPVKYEESVRSHSVRGPGGLYKNSGLQFWHALILTRSNSIRTQLLCSASWEQLKSLHVAAPAWRSKTAASSARAEGSNFILDGLEEAVGRHRLTGTTDPTQHFLRRRIRLVDSPKPIISYEPVYNEIGETRFGSGEDFSDFSKRVKDRMLSLLPGDAFPMHLLATYFEQEISVSDLYEASEGFHSLLDIRNSQSMDSQDRFHITRIPAFNLPGLTASLDEATSMINIYNNLISRWLSPLNPLVAGRIRLVKEQLIRRIAAELSLASHCIRKRHSVPEASQEQETPQTTESQAELPVLSSQTVPSSSLPTPSPSTSPSLHGQAFSEAPSSALDRLRSYTTINLPSALPTASTSTQRILSHWSLYSSPSDYNWAATTTALSRSTEADTASSALSDRQRARLRRKSEKLAARTARENTLATSYAETLARAPALLSSSQLPISLEVPSASQSQAGTDKKRRREAGFNIPFRPPASPAGLGLGLASSPALQRTQGASQMLPPASSQSIDTGLGAASQIEPGRFGGRASLGPKRKKRRTEGF